MASASVVIANANLNPILKKLQCVKPAVHSNARAHLIDDNVTLIHSKYIVKRTKFER